MNLPWAGKNRHSSGQPRIPMHQSHEYKVYMRSPYWKEKREACMKRDGNRCQDCGATATQVHHKTYDRLFNEDLEDLVALCVGCHRTRHGKMRMPKLPVRRSRRFQNSTRRKRSKRWQKKSIRLKN